MLPTGWNDGDLGRTAFLLRYGQPLTAESWWEAWGGAVEDIDPEDFEQMPEPVKELVRRKLADAS